MTLGEIVRSRAYDERLAARLALGKDIGGAPVVTDLAKMPHLLIAAPRAPQIVAINAMVCPALQDRLSTCD